jgi:predicted PurR-regulated permease PerM
MKLRKHSKYFLFALFVLLLIGAFLIVKPFIGAILTSLVLGYIFFPVYKWMNKWIKKPTITALLMILLLLIIIFVPAFFFFNMLFGEAAAWYGSYQSTDIALFFQDHFNVVLTESAIGNIDNVLGDIQTYVFTEVSSFVFSLPMKIISFVIMMFIIFFVFRDGEKIVNAFKKTMPIEESHKYRVFKKVETTVNSLVYGEIAISILEGIVAIIGFWLLGVSSPVLWGLVVAIVALLPAIGPLVVWLPMSIIMFLQGDTIPGIGVFLFGAIILTLLLDIIIKPKVLGYKGHIHPIIILLGVLGGLTVFGLTGIILGPVILVLLILLVEIYIKEGIN